VYYFAVPKAMIFKDPVNEEPLRPAALVGVVVALAVIALLMIFVLPNAFAHLGDVAVLAAG
jgi:NADH:ubiquinone oxidoreductase subunit 2 (subunit N)